MVKLTNLISLVTWLTVAVTSQTDFNGTDPCALLYGKPFLSYSEAIACNKNFPLDPSSKLEHLRILKNSLQFYAFLDIAKSSPTPSIPSQVDLLAKLDAIGKMNISTEFEFHDKLTRLFLSLHDGHTTYISACNIAFSYKQPFPLVSIVKPDGTVVVKVLDQFVQVPQYVAYWKGLGLDIYKYAGKSINLIDGQLPMDYLKRYADESVGVSRDINSRLSLVFARVLSDLGRWGVTFGSHASTTLPPKQPHINYTFNMGDREEKVSVPYLVVNPNTFKDSPSFFNAHCSIHPTLKSKDPTFELEANTEVQQVQQVVELKPDFQLEPESRQANGLNNPIVKGIFSQAYLLDNNNTGVLTIPSFSPLGLNYFFNETKQAIRQFRLHNTTNLIIDVSNNGGGIICLGYWFLEMLFPKTYQNFHTDFKLHPLFNQLSKLAFNQGGFYDPSRWVKPDKSKFTSAEQFLIARNFTRGGTNSGYSQLFDDFCPSNPYSDLMQELHFEAPFKSENIAIVSNGICYSTCTLVSYGLQLNHNVSKSFVVGGTNNLNSKATVASLAGGTVYNLYSLILEVLNNQLNSSPLAPIWPPFKVAMGYTAREAYLPNTDLPLEFASVLATKHLPYTANSLLDPYQVWLQVAKEF